jgi:hypothetical protein
LAIPERFAIKLGMSYTPDAARIITSVEAFGDKD